jgi:hypothetical protein
MIYKADNNEHTMEKNMIEYLVAKKALFYSVPSITYE